MPQPRFDSNFGLKFLINRIDLTDSGKKKIHFDDTELYIILMLFHKLYLIPHSKD